MRSVSALFSIVLFALLQCCVGLPHPDTAGDLADTSLKRGEKFIRDTCVDPAFAIIFSEAFQPGPDYHLIDREYRFDAANTLNSAATWVSIRGIFRAWPVYSIGTLPLWQLASTDRKDYIYQLGVDTSTAPVVTGFPNDKVIIAWAYATQVCGSVPLYGAANYDKTDHIYTTNPFDHGGIISPGYAWGNDGVIAYVLPL